MIPVLIVPVLANADRLYQMLNTIDHEVRTLIVIDNGEVVSQHRLTETNRAYIGRSRQNTFEGGTEVIGLREAKLAGTGQEEVPL